MSDEGLPTLSTPSAAGNRDITDYERPLARVKFTRGAMGKLGYEMTVDNDMSEDDARRMFDVALAGLRHADAEIAYYEAHRNDPAPTIEEASDDTTA